MSELLSRSLDDKRRGKKRKTDRDLCQDIHEGNITDRSDEADSCPICLDPHKGKACFITECGHKFHFLCIKASLTSRNASCPLCRKDFSEMTPPCELPPPRVHRTFRHATLQGSGIFRVPFSATNIHLAHNAIHALLSAVSSAVASPPSRQGARSHAQDPSALPRTIQDWKFCRETRVVKGRVYNFSGWPNGEPISTSPVVSSSGRSIRTFSGSEYVLGQIDPSFEATLGDIYDPANPFLGLL